MGNETAEGTEETDRRDRERTRNGERGGRTEVRRPTGSGREKTTVGGECDGVPGVLQGRKFQLDSALTTSGTGGTEDWSRHSGECPRPTWTWASSRRQNTHKESTPVSWPDTASSLRMRQADTVAEWPYSTNHHHFLHWRPQDSMG